MTIGLKGERFMMVKNEFEVVHVPRFREDDIVQFAEAVEATHGIYENRCVKQGVNVASAYGLGGQRQDQRVEGWVLGIRYRAVSGRCRRSAQGL